jgi:uncharacterized protein with FMN-binding domain
MKKVIVIMIVVLGIIFILYLSMTSKMEKELQDLEFYEVDWNGLTDGMYQGEAETTFVKVVVQVEVYDHKITQIDILKHDNGFGKKAEPIVLDMIDQNSFEVAVISGATSSSLVIKSAVSDALANGKL